MERPNRRSHAGEIEEPGNGQGGIEFSHQIEHDLCGSGGNANALQQHGDGRAAIVPSGKHLPERRMFMLNFGQVHGPLSPKNILSAALRAAN